MVFATLERPGTFVVQSLPFSRQTSRVFSVMPQNLDGVSRGEGSVMGGLIELFDGDRFF